MVSFLVQTLNHTSQALLTGSADIVGVTETHALSNLHAGDVAANLTDRSHTFVAKGHSTVKVVLICATETRVARLNVNFVGLEGASGLISHNLALFGAAEDLESDAHFVKTGRVLNMV